MKAVTASIVHEDPYMAGRQTAFEILGQLEGQRGQGSSSPDLVLAFVSSRHAPERVLEGFWSCLPATTRLMGCSSFAEIGDADAMTGSVTAMGIDLGGVDWSLFKMASATGSGIDAGRALGREILPFGASLLVVLSDGALVNSSGLVRGLREILGDGTAIMGGVASDQFEFARTFELHDREVLRGGVVALALRGPISFATVAKAGFQPVGVTRTCTRVEDDRLLLELDGVSALSIYKEFLGADVTLRPLIGLEFPLAFNVGGSGDYMTSDGRTQFIRAVRHLDEERGGLVCGGDVVEGAKVRMTRATKGDLIDSATLACREARRAIRSPELGLFFNCAGRKLVLGARHQEEIRAAFGELPPDMPKVGFYTFGEIAPVGGVSTFHDETFAAVLVGAS